MEAKTTRCYSIQAAEVACSKAISKAEAQKISQTVMFQEEHSKYLWSLEEQAFWEESRSCHDISSPPVRPPCATVCSHLGGLWLPHITCY